jgi:hypothetical protein
MKRYVVLIPYYREPNMRRDVWRILKETDDLVEAITAWEACGEEDEAVLMQTVREHLDV